MQPDSKEQRTVFEKSLMQLGEKYPDTADFVRKVVLERMELELAAKACGISVEDARKQWCFARAWLLTDLKQERID